MKNGNSQTNTKAVETVSNVGEAEEVERLSTYMYSYHLIKELEGFRTRAYRDGRHYSIGVGTKSHSGQMLSKEEIYSAYNRELEPRVDKVKKDYPEKSTCKQSAIVSLLYNCYSCYRDIQRYGISEKLRKSMVRAYDKKTKERAISSGLKKRRNRERQQYTMC